MCLLFSPKFSNCPTTEDEDGRGKYPLYQDFFLLIANLFEVHGMATLDFGFYLLVNFL